MSGRPAALPNTKTEPPLAPYMNVLAHVAMDDHFSPLDDLAQLVLGIAMHS